jgi:hypothetical protein
MTLEHFYSTPLEDLTRCVLGPTSRQWELSSLAPWCAAPRTPRFHQYQDRPVGGVRRLKWVYICLYPTSDRFIPAIGVA